MTAAEGETADLLVIGGGINGAAIACDAAGRGLSVVLVEMRDFAEGTSSRSSKLIHGGLRYLETYDFRLVREALGEREILMAKAPHLVWPIRLVLPHVPGLRSRWMIRLGLMLYDHLARRKTLQGSESIDFVHHAFGAALTPELRRGFAYSDCRTDDARLVIATLLGAQANGARILPRHRFVCARRVGGSWEIDLENLSGGAKVRVKARTLANAAGPWVMGVGAAIEDHVGDRRLRLVKGSHIVVPRQWEGEHGYFLQTRDGRTMEAFPYEEGFTSIGTTDEPWDEAPENVRISEGEIEYMLDEANRYLRRPVARADVIWSYAGVRPLFEVGGARDAGLSTLTRDYAFAVEQDAGRAPLLTVYGGKLTTHRRLGEDAVSRLAQFLGPLRASRTAEEVLPGGDFGAGGVEGFATVLAGEFPWLPERQRRRYVRQYGTWARQLLSGARGMSDLGECFGWDLYAREVDYLVDSEWARTVDDIAWRRTKLGLRLTGDDLEKLSRHLHARGLT